MNLTRRHVLAVSSSLVAAASLGAVGVGVSWWDRAPGEGLTALSGDEYQMVQALSEAWMPAGGEPSLSGADANIGAFVDDVLLQMVPTQRKLLKLLIQALDASTLVTHGSSYVFLTREERTRVLQSWVDSPRFAVRQPVSALLVLMSMGWTMHPIVTDQVRPWFGCGYGR